METIFTDGFLKEIGFTLIKREVSKFSPYRVYGCAKDRIGMTYLYWNNEGHSCTYFGDKLESNVSFSIKKDSDTRIAFNGYVFNSDEVKLLLKLTL